MKSITSSYTGVWRAADESGLKSEQRVNLSSGNDCAFSQRNLPSSYSMARILSKAASVVQFALLAYAVVIVTF
jgi:hypothetical protein